MPICTAISAMCTFKLLEVFKGQMTSQNNSQLCLNIFCFLKTGKQCNLGSKDGFKSKVTSQAEMLNRCLGNTCLPHTWVWKWNMSALRVALFYWARKLNPGIPLPYPFLQMEPRNTFVCSPASSSPKSGGFFFCSGMVAHALKRTPHGGFSSPHHHSSPTLVLECPGSFSLSWTCPLHSPR